MTVNELLALLGRAWSRLLIYPGGAAAFALVWVVARVRTRSGEGTAAGEGRGARDDGGIVPRLSSIVRSIGVQERSWLLFGAVVPPWLGLAALPLPLAVGLSRQFDLMTVLALLELPQLLAVAHEIRDERTRFWGARRLTAALNGYPPLALAALALAQAAGTFEIAALARPPGDLAPASAGLLHWLGAAAWALALPPALGLGPFSAGACTRGALSVGLRLRGIGLAALAALPWVALLGGLEEGVPPTLLRALTWLAPPLVLVALLWGFDRLAAGQSARRWARAYLLLDAGLLLALLWAAYDALGRRLA